MTDLRNSAEALIKHWEAGEFQNCTGDMAGHIRLLRQALAMENFSEVNQEIEEALRQALTEPGKGWVGLTGQELQDLCDQYHDDKIVTVENLLLATEALLRGKNT